MVQNISSHPWERSLLSMEYEARRTDIHETNQPVIYGGKSTINLAYSYCEQVTVEHSRSFHIASGLLPRPKRKAVRALYAFCRVADDIVDEGEEPRELTFRKYKVSSLAPHPSPDDAVSVAWADTRAAYRIPVGYSEQLLAGIERDLYPHRYQSFEDLAIYCYGVASTVGLMSMYIIGFESLQAIQYAIKLGVALQLTNILRDIGEDWRTGRLYLPLEELEAFKITEADISTGRVDERWREFMRFQIDRNRRLYSEALPGIQLLNPEGRLAVASAAHFYQGILSDIERHDYNVFTRRAHVNNARKLKLLYQASRQAKQQ